MVTVIKWMMVSALMCISCSSLQAEDKIAEAEIQKPQQWSELARLQQTTSFRYEEMRDLELLDVPWQGGGLLLVSKDSTLVKLQMRPQRKIMAITPVEMIYFDSETGERHRLPLSTPHPMTRQAMIFQDLLQGRKDRISADYEITFQQNTSDWSLNFTPKQTTQKPVFNQITMRGNDGSGTRKIDLKERSGDSSSLTMHVLDTGSQLEFMIERLLREAIGQ